MGSFKFFTGTDLAKPHEDGKPDVYRDHFEFGTGIFHLVGSEAKEEMRCGYVDEAFLKDKDAKAAYEAFKNPSSPAVIEEEQKEIEIFKKKEGEIDPEITPTGEVV